MTRADLIDHGRALAADLSKEQTAHAATQAALAAAETARERARTATATALNECRATEHDWNTARIALWRAKKERRFARWTAAAALAAAAVAVTVLIAVSLNE